ncbi:MAG: peptidylprolyl isomerase [Burkholderiaceae bacterium]|nr:peptidylprolyl isomerase [Burkholderiaceae bacterium]
MSMMNLRSLFARAALTAGVASLAACGGGGSDSPAPAPAPQVIGSPNPKPTAPTTVCSAAGIAAAKLTTNAAVCMLTSDGEIVFELRADKAPVSAANFLKYVKDGFYTNTIFHRVSKVAGVQVVQGGGFATGTVAKAATYPAIVLESENGLKNVRGSLAMARTDVADSATSQFYINTADNSGTLDFKATTPATKNGYAVYGSVISGIDTIDKIYAEPVLNAAREVPAVEVLIYWAQQIQ